MKLETIKGHKIAPARLTGGALRLAALYIFLPFLALMAVLDGLIYLVARFAFSTCYGVWCWF